MQNENDNDFLKMTNKNNWFKWNAARWSKLLFYISSCESMLEERVSLKLNRLRNNIEQSYIINLIVGLSNKIEPSFKIFYYYDNLIIYSKRNILLFEKA